jgi:hypothetical protein
MSLCLLLGAYFHFPMGLCTTSRTSYMSMYTPSSCMDISSMVEEVSAVVCGEGGVGVTVRSKICRIMLSTVAFRIPFSSCDAWQAISSSSLPHVVTSINRRRLSSLLSIDWRCFWLVHCASLLLAMIASRLKHTCFLNWASDPSLSCSCCARPLMSLFMMVNTCTINWCRTVCRC